MTFEEFKKTGKDGVYRADLDAWFVEGEEPPRPAPTLQPVASRPVTTANVAAEPEAKPAAKPSQKTEVKR